MRISGRAWMVVLSVIPVVFVLVLALGLGFGMRDFRALGRHWANRQAPSSLGWQAPEGGGELTDFSVAEDGRILAIRDGGLCAVEGGNLRPLEANQGLLSLFPQQESGKVWATGTYHRVLALDGTGRSHHDLTVRGAIRNVQNRGDLLGVGFEDAQLERGRVAFFRRLSAGFFEPEGLEIAVGMDRWSGFDLSADGTQLLANLPSGKGVGVWSTATGQLLASWPTERSARVLFWIDAERVLFDKGPTLTIRDAAFANPGNRLMMARVGVSEGLTVVTENFAAVLSSTRGPAKSQIAFGDMEGLVRVVDLGPSPRQRCVFAPKQRGLPWRLRPSEQGLWVYLKSGSSRLEHFKVDGLPASPR
ncbi:MAG: hypothetical protein Q8O00_06360 [Holophaga sp.]|nr:hypothetical protein [Holophaga sp.]